MILSLNQHQKIELLSSDTALADPGTDQNLYTSEFLNQIDVAGIPPRRLVTSPGAVVIVLRNLNPKAGVCNGSRLLVETVTRT
ncbi:hypothetical protein V8E36_009071 [Tilletia maclaganii]